MTRTEILYLLPYLGSLTIFLGIFYYAWQRRQIKGVNAYRWYVAGRHFDPYVVNQFLGMIEKHIYLVR